MSHERAPTQQGRAHMWRAAVEASHVAALGTGRLVGEVIVADLTMAAAEGGDKSSTELMTQIAGILHSGVEKTPQLITVAVNTIYGELFLDSKTYIVRSPLRPGDIVRLTPMETRILWLLMTNPTSVISNENIYAAMHDDKIIIQDPRFVKVYILRIRNKLESPLDHSLPKNERKQLIHTKIGFGYTLKDTLAQDSTEPASIPASEQQTRVLHYSSTAMGGELVLNPLKNLVESPLKPLGKITRLTPFEGMILEVMMQNPRGVFSLRDFARALCQGSDRPDLTVTDQVVRTEISRLRHKLGDNKIARGKLRSRIIFTHHGRGYSLTPPTYYIPL